MAVMAKKKPGASKRPNREGVPVNFWLDEALAAAFGAYVESTSPRVSKTAAHEAAIREFLERKGFWPPKGDGEEGGGA